MSDLLLPDLPVDFSREEVDAYFDGARAAIRLYATWKDGDQYVGQGRLLRDVLADLEATRLHALRGTEK